MIRKLRIKIVLVIVLVAAVMLGVIFGMSYTMTRQDLRAQSLSMMQAIAANPFEPIPPGQSRQVRLPYFVLRTDAFGNLVAIGSTDYDLTDRSFLRAVVAAASASEADIGEIPAYHLRFCRVDGSVIFADISSEQQTLQGLVRSSLLIGGESLLALADHLGIPREATLAVGDSENDRAMLEKAGVAAVMANGMEQIRKLADIVSENDNDHDGVAEIFARLGL